MKMPNLFTRKRERFHMPVKEDSEENTQFILETISKNDIPIEVMRVFELRASEYTADNSWNRESFDQYFLVRHPDGVDTYITGCEKEFQNVGKTRTAFFVDSMKDKIVGQSALALRLDSTKDYHNIPYSTWIHTAQKYQHRGLGERRIGVMNTYCHKKLEGLSLFSSNAQSDEAAGLWKKLEKEGRAEKIKFIGEGTSNYFRYKYIG